MYIELNNNKYYLSGNFDSKVSHLRKKNNLKVKFNLYLQPNDSGKRLEYTLKDLDYFKNLDNLPDIIYFTNSYYWWIFEGVELADIKVLEDKDYVSMVSNYYQQRKNQRRFVVEIEFNYKDVFGTNNRKIFDRDLLLRNILL